jgi:hypothetical protein
MDPAQDCIIKLNTPIRSQEENSLIIFQLSQEYGYQSIVVVMERCAACHERVRFI